jgi:AcrR family transcriptional regulator
VPTQTFWNLPEAKREALVRIALEEFADHDYTAASVSRVVARAGIAKGSLYQYFGDKQDLFLHLVDRAQSTLLDEVASGSSVPAPGDTEPGLFTSLRAQMDATVRAGVAHPLEVRLLDRAYTGHVPFHDEVLARGRTLRREHLHHMVEQGIARGELSPSLDADVATMVVDAVVAAIGPHLLEKLMSHRTAPQQIDASQFDAPEIQQVFDQVMAILGDGLRRSS